VAIEIRQGLSDLKESVKNELEVLGDKNIYHIKKFKEDLADIELDFAGLIKWEFEFFRLNLITELVGGIEFSDYTLNEKVNLMDDENFNVFVEFVKRTKHWMKTV